MNHKLRSVLIILILAVLLIPVYYIYRWLQTVMKPRQSPAHLFLFLITCLLLVIRYTMFVVGLIAKLFPINR